MSRAYYNENDPFAAAWLRELIANGLIARGDVDERSVVDVRADDLAGYSQCHFFAGIGGWSLALRMAGWPDDRPVWTGSCPCQPFSQAGKRWGVADERHLWPTWVHLIRERAPAIVFGEQVASATAWLRLVRSDLEALGYAVGAIPVEAASAGADHLRDRFWFVADRSQQRRNGAGHAGPRGRHEHSDGCRALLADAAGERRPGPGPMGEPLHPAARGGREADQSLDAGTRADCALADADEPFRRLGDEQPAGQFAQQQQDQRARDSGNVGHADGERSFSRKQATTAARHGHPADATSGGYEWVIGADGKARRTLAGLRLLVDGFPARVGLLRGFGNAIDPRPASQFIAAAEETISEAT